MSSVRQIAREVGVSVATVSRALNHHPGVKESTRRAVLEAADRASYTPRTGKRQTDVIGLVYPTDPVEAEYGAFESAILTGIMRGIDEQRFDVTLINLGRDKRKNETFSQFFTRKGLRGVIIRTVDTEPRLAEAIAAEGFPCVAIAEVSSQPNLNYICGDSRLDSVRAIEHLIHNGHRRIALAHHTVLDHDHRDRLEGYKEALRSHGIEIDPELVQAAPGTLRGGSRAIDRLLAIKSPPTALFLTTPLMTVGALHRCLELGLHVPNDLSIVGVDDAQVRKSTYPQFTAVCQDASQMGLEAARWLTRRLSGLGPAEFRVRRPTMFEVNGSTGPAPSKPAFIRPNGEVVPAQ